MPSILIFRAINFPGVLIGERGALGIINAKNITMEIGAINMMAGMGNIKVIGITTGITNKTFSIGLGSNVVKNFAMIKEPSPK